MTTIAGISPIDHVSDGLSKLISQYRGLPRAEGWLRAHLEQDRELENAIFAVLAARDVDTCDETRLAVLAKLVGQPPRGTTLEAFRTFVKGAIAANRSMASGSRGPLRVALILDPFARAQRVYPASLRVFLRGTWTGSEDKRAAAALIKRATGAGIGIEVLDRSGEATGKRFFRFRYSTDTPAGTNGFGITTTPGIGGVFAITLQTT